MTDQPTRLVRFYAASLRFLLRGFTLARACFNGLWLGLLSHRALQRIDAYYYAGGFGAGVREYDYLSESYNLRGLWPWESEALDRFFPDRRHILLVSAGAGRELIALVRAGFQVDAFECHDGLRAAGNALLERHSLAARIRSVPRDHGPAGTADYDGAIVGWGAYMLIPGRQQRIRFLAELRQRIRDDAPILLSFFSREGDRRGFFIVALLANLCRLPFFRPRIEIGDNLIPNFAHFFVRAEIEAELDAAGFRLAHYTSRGYPHAVGVAGRAPCTRALT